MSKERIRAWYEHWEGQVYIAFSGGKDSTVLLHLVRELYKDVPAVFSDTGLEYPEIKQFVRSHDNVVVVKPKISFKEVLTKYGYPVVSKKVSRAIRDLQNPTSKNETTRNLYLTGINGQGKESPSFKLSKKWHKLIDAPFKISEKCCDIMKKNPSADYEKQTLRKPYIGVLASESQVREILLLKNGCNAFNLKTPKSTPLAFWTEQDILRYLRDYNIPYASIYGEIKEDGDGNLYTTGEKRTGCVFCALGVQAEKGENRFQRLARTHPKLYKYCMEDLGMKEVLDYIGVDCTYKECGLIASKDAKNPAE